MTHFYAVGFPRTNLNGQTCLQCPSTLTVGLIALRRISCVNQISTELYMSSMNSELEAKINFRTICIFWKIWKIKTSFQNFKTVFYNQQICKISAKEINHPEPIWNLKFHNLTHINLLLFETMKTLIVRT